MRPKWFRSRAFRSSFRGSVAYDNLAKEQRLFVKRDTLEKFGAVSRETAEEMALGLIKSGDTLAVSTTGIAGPSGGSKEKPVGTVWFGLADDKGVLHSEKRVSMATERKSG